ncbi:TfuA-like protein [Rhizobiaceae bacterium n13]|uniref:TfuA-like protein n=1 Tax=Ferirhizobium litorale TaxID=2927786 RepID=A0AAE3QCD6_9HYPH|nr:TfuA-like protein [Fererhizobium litorale]MDI7862216.1 TfuA-like protein [Fererhizobium litorale]MDI7922510.1 TfuA-like protein [Fererhizobium litorale]
MTEANTDSPILVFLGPTLRQAEAQAVLDAIYLQPASQGDIILAAHAFRPKAMVLIDGQFEDRPAVRHKEILWAMAQGITMIGAASMGALRAAELSAFGMIGTGLIYRWYRRWPIAADDAVAIHSGPAELGFVPLTDALVDLQRTFSALARMKLITRNECLNLTSIAQALNFRDRSFDAVLRTVGWPRERTAELKKNIVRQKAGDAMLALRLAPYIVEERQKHPSNISWVATNTFIRDLEASGIDVNLVSSYNIKL